MRLRSAADEAERPAVRARKMLGRQRRHGRRAEDREAVAVRIATGTPVARSLRITRPLTLARPRPAFSAATPTHFVAANGGSADAAHKDWKKCPGAIGTVSFGGTSVRFSA